MFLSSRTMTTSPGLMRKKGMEPAGSKGGFATVMTLLILITAYGAGAFQDLVMTER